MRDKLVKSRHFKTQLKSEGDKKKNANCLIYCN